MAASPAIAAAERTSHSLTFLPASQTRFSDMTGTSPATNPASSAYPMIGAARNVLAVKGAIKPFMTHFGEAGSGGMRRLHGFPAAAAWRLKAAISMVAA